MTTLQPQRRVVFSSGIWEQWSSHHTRVVFSGELTVSATPEDTDEYRARAAALGHPDTASLCRAHDLLHLWCAQLLSHGKREPGPITLRAVAEERVIPDWLSGGEEAMVLALHRWITLRVADPWLAPLVLAGADMDELRRSARALLRLDAESGDPAGPSEAWLATPRVEEWPQ